MAHRRKFVIYLAGPISDCNEAQMKFWRNEVKSKYASKFEFRDPVDNLMDEKVAASEIIKADLEAIENADGLLVNMWRESLGSAIGIVHAHQKGRPVVVANPNHIRNHMLEFYTDIMADSPIKAAKELHDLLRAETSWQVMKSGERKEEPFNRRKLIDALRFACRDADCDDIVLPRMVLPRVIDSLTKSDRTIRRNLPTGAIDEAVKDVLLDLADEFPDAIGGCANVAGTPPAKAGFAAGAGGKNPDRRNRCAHCQFQESWNDLGQGYQEAGRYQVCRSPRNISQNPVRSGGDEDLNGTLRSRRFKGVLQCIGIFLQDPVRD